MPNIIKQGNVVADHWQVLRRDEHGVLPEVSPEQAIIIPLVDWLVGREIWQDRTGSVAVWLAPDDDPAQLLVDLSTLPLVAIDFPSFTDGRGYSHARLLRERYDYRGELRAIGDVWQDLLYSLAQVGFDAFVIKDGKEVSVALDGLNAFSENYQSTYLSPLPLFRRRVTLW
ncbi:DUF934 domain-containing protein [Neisseriaceae bacterium TC5R-5]|nr:DUF934 domain-containing protein [Neisseriaceae bacterium TC5R-5]